MVKVRVANNVKREDVLVSEETTIRAIFESNGIDYSRGTTTIDGSPLGAGELNKTLAQLGYTGEDGKDKCYLYNVVKADNAQA